MTMPLRADARRNRDAILTATRRLISAQGPEVPMEAIADGAGVAVGTLYRHFPTKADLVQAALGQLVETMVTDLEAVADRVAAGAAALPELVGLVARVLDGAAQDRAIKAVAGALGAGYPDELQDRADAALNRLIAAARRERALRDDVTVEDFYLLLDTAPTDVAPAVLHRWRDLMLAGLTARDQ